MHREIDYIYHSGCLLRQLTKLTFHENVSEILYLSKLYFRFCWFIILRLSPEIATWAITVLWNRLCLYESTYQYTSRSSWSLWSIDNAWNYSPHDHDHHHQCDHHHGGRDYAWKYTLIIIVIIINAIVLVTWCLQVLTPPSR